MVERWTKYLSESNGLDFDHASLFPQSETLSFTPPCHHYSRHSWKDVLVKKRELCSGQLGTFDKRSYEKQKWSNDCLGRILPCQILDISNLRNKSGQERWSNGNWVNYWSLFMESNSIGTIRKCISGKKR